MPYESIRPKNTLVHVTHMTFAMAVGSSGRREKKKHLSMQGNLGSSKCPVEEAGVLRGSVVLLRGHVHFKSIA